MNLTLRGVALDPDSAALAMTAALRALDAAGVQSPAVWIAHGSARLDSTTAWDHGIAMIRVDGPDAETSARSVAEAVGTRIVMGAADLGNLGAPRGDGARLAARHELGLWPDEHVTVALGADRDPATLRARLDAFDARLVADPAVPRRLILADLVRHGPALGEPLVEAILHPYVLVEIERHQPTLDLLRFAADEVVDR